jgi:hypothetical protein
MGYLPVDYSITSGGPSVPDEKNLPEVIPFKYP